MDNDKQNTQQMRAVPTLPGYARRSLNRCNLPAVILGSLTFQQLPSPLYIDGVLQLHHALFTELDALNIAEARALHFMDYMSVQFRLHALEEAGYAPQQRLDRSRANYQRLLRGWHFNADGQEGGVLKGWVESRFGLSPLYHGGAITSRNDDAYLQYLRHYTDGVYNTNAIEAQLDLVYSYCQYELQREGPSQSHLTLYRGLNTIERLQLEGACAQGSPLLFNNINSFSRSLERADEFGDRIICVQVPREKVFFYSELLPGCLQGEAEVIVLGGVYCAEIMH